MKHSIIRAMGAVALALIAMPSAASAAYVTVYGSPVLGPGVIFPGSGTVNTGGTAVGTIWKYDGPTATKGSRAVRWDASGATVELDNLGMNSAGFTMATARSINDAGTAVGDADKYDSGFSKGYRAVRWNPSGTGVTELGALGTDGNGITASVAFSINAAGDAVGWAEKYTSGGTYLGERAVRWNASGTVATELANLGRDTDGETICSANAINSAGVVVGSADKYNASGVYQGSRAVRWGASGAAEELGDGRTPAGALALNDAGVVVGGARHFDASGADKGVRAVRWNASGAATELGTLGMDAGGATEAQAVAINAAGTAVGYAAKYDGSGVGKGRRAVRWDAGGAGATELGILGAATDGTSKSDVFAINAAGVAVGYAETYNGVGFDVGPRAVYWGPGDVPVDLNTLIDPAGGWTLREAHAVSDTNWITGIASFDPDGPGGQAPYDRLFLIQVPEPGGLALLSLSGVMLLRRRRRGAKHWSRAAVANAIGGNER